jgi:alkanesulfonate monooxygenase SsuD/methylene tetrahydromethanopterin reductase-like flavin-dependent oxidoreductase (luciferase family)
MHILDRPAGGPRQALIGTPEQAAEDIHAYARVGVSHLVLGFRTTDGQEVLQ